MSSFTAPLIVRVEQRERAGRGLYTVMEPFTYQVGRVDSGVEITVPAGFETDLASIPRLARWLISPGGLHAKAAVLHDALYHDAAQRQWFQLTRENADETFLEAMEVLGVPAWRKQVMYYSVRLFGGAVWAKQKRQRVNV
jgi:hypothetical protein